MAESTRAKAVASLGVLMGLAGAAGCFYPGTGAVDAKARYDLAVQVVGIEADMEPLQGAHVALRDARGTRSAATDTGGRARFSLPMNDTFTLEFSADGWGPGETLPIRTPYPDMPQNPTLESLVDVVACVASLGLFCNATTTFLLYGKAATLQVHLVRPLLQDSFNVTLSPHLYANAGPGVRMPDDGVWFPQEASWGSTNSSRTLYEQHWVSRSAQLVWTNGAGTRADLAVGIGCNHNSPEATSAVDMASNQFAYDGRREARVSLPSPHRASLVWWGATPADPCPEFFGGPVLKSLNTDVQAQIDFTFHFDGGTQIPRVLMGKGATYTSVTFD